MNDNYHAAMNAPTQQHNSDGSDQQIEMYADSWQVIYEYGRDLLAIFGVVCAALIVGLLTLRIFN